MLYRSGLAAGRVGGGGVAKRVLIAAHTQTSQKTPSSLLVNINLSNKHSIIRMWSDAPSSKTKQEIRWSNEQPPTQPKKKKPGARLGRVAMVEHGSKMSKTGTPKLCTGCGVEMIGGRDGYSKQLRK